MAIKFRNWQLFKNVNERLINKLARVLTQNISEVKKNHLQGHLINVLVVKTKFFFDRINRIFFFVLTVSQYLCGKNFYFNISIFFSNLVSINFKI